MSTPVSSNDIPNGSETLLSASSTNPKSKPPQGATSLDGTSVKGSGGKEVPQKLLENKDLSELRSCYDDIIKNMPENYLETAQLLERQLLDSHILSILECSHFATANQTILKYLVERVTCKEDVLDLCESLLLLKNAPQLISIVENLRMAVGQNLQISQPQPPQQNQQNQQQGPKQQSQQNTNGHNATDQNLSSNQTSSITPNDNVKATSYDDNPKSGHCIVDDEEEKDDDKNNNEMISDETMSEAMDLAKEMGMGQLFSTFTGEAGNSASSSAENQPGPFGQVVKSVFSGMMSQDGSQSNDKFVQGMVSMATHMMGDEMNPLEGDDSLSSEDVTQLVGTMFSGMMGNLTDSSKCGSQSNDQGNKTNSSKAESQSTNPFIQAMAMFPSMMGNPQGGSQSNDQFAQAMASVASSMMGSKTNSSKGKSQSTDPLPKAKSSTSPGGGHKLRETAQGTQLPNTQDLRAIHNQYFSDTPSKSHSSTASQSHTTKPTAKGATQRQQETQSTQLPSSSQHHPPKHVPSVNDTHSKSTSDTRAASVTQKQKQTRSTQLSSCSQRHPSKHVSSINDTHSKSKSDASAASKNRTSVTTDSTKGVTQKQKQTRSTQLSSCSQHHPSKHVPSVNDTHSKSTSAASKNRTSVTTASTKGVTRRPQGTQNIQHPPLKPIRVVNDTLSKSKIDTSVDSQTSSSVATAAAAKGAQKPQHKIYVQYYSKLIAILEVDSTPHFVTAEIITFAEEDEITKLSATSNTAAMRMLLKPVSFSLEADNTTSFYNMLEIIQKHGNNAAQCLADEIFAKVGVKESDEAQKSQPNHYKIYVQYYSKLIAILEVDLTPHFVTAEIITFSEEDEIVKLSATSNTAAMKMLLKPVSFPLEKAGYTTSFYKMLEIIQLYGNDAAQCLAAEIFAEVKKLGVEQSDATEELPSTTPITDSTTCPSESVVVSTSASRSTEELPPTTPITHSTRCTREAAVVSTSVSNFTDIEVTSLTNSKAQMSKPPSSLQGTLATGFDVTSEHEMEIIQEHIPQKSLDHGATEELPSTTHSTAAQESQQNTQLSSDTSNHNPSSELAQVVSDTASSQDETNQSSSTTAKGSHCCHFEKPKLKELVLYSDKISSRWKEVALQLDIPRAVVNTIDIDRNEMKSKCYHMFNTWLQRTVGSCWCQFVSALVKVGLLETAKEIQLTFIGEGHVLSDAKLEEKLRQHDQDSNNELPPPLLPLSHIERPELLNSMVDALLQNDTSNINCVDILITGMAGYGKTTLAKSLCHHPSIKKWFSAGFLWIHLGPAPKTKPVATLLSVYKKVTGKPWTPLDAVAKTKVEFSEEDTMAALSSELQTLCRNAKILVILDDVWGIEDARAYIDTFSCCKLVVTSRRKDFPQNFDCKNKVFVEGMTPTEATNLLTIEKFQPLDSDTIKKLDELAVNLHYWPLLLSLVRRQFQKHYDMKPNISAIAVIKKASQKLSKYGLTAFDPSTKETAATACIKASLDFLDEIVVTRLVRLVTSYTFGNIFPKSLLSTLWEIDSEEVDNCCEALWSIGLLQYVDLPHNVDAESTDGIEIHSYIIQYVFDNELDRAFSSMRDFSHTFVQNASSFYKYMINLYKNAIISGSLLNFSPLLTFIDSMFIPTTLKAVPMILHLVTNALVKMLPPTLSQFINVPKRNTFIKLRQQCRRMISFIENEKNEEALTIYEQEKKNCHQYLREMYINVPHQLNHFIDQHLSQISNQLNECFALPEAMLKFYLKNRSRLLSFFTVDSTKSMEERLKEMLKLLNEMFHDLQSTPHINKIYEQITTFSQMSADTESDREAMLRRLASSQLPNVDPDAMAKLMNNPSACCVM